MAVSWWEDRIECAKYARWLCRGRWILGTTDMLDFFDDPLAWERSRLSGHLRDEYESEQAA